MRVIARQQEEGGFDLCDAGTFGAVLQDNPDMILLVTKKDCPLCPSMQEAADRIGEERQMPVLELAFHNKSEGPCPTLDDVLKLGNDVGVAVVFKGGREVGHRKSTGFVDRNVEIIKKLLERT